MDVLISCYHANKSSPDLDTAALLMTQKECKKKKVLFFGFYFNKYLPGRHKSRNFHYR